MSTIVVGADSTSAPLVALDDVKADLKIAGTEVSQDTVLSDLIARASSMVEGYIGRPVTSSIYQEDFRIPLDERRLSLHLTVTPILEIQSVTRDRLPVENADPQWEFSPRAGLLYPPDTFGQFWCGGRYRVTYQAGWIPPGTLDDQGMIVDATVPPDIKAAVIATVRALYYGGGRDPMLKSETEQGVGSTSWNVAVATGGGLPPDATAILDRGYVNPGIF